MNSFTAYSLFVCLSSSEKLHELTFYPLACMMEEINLYFSFFHSGHNSFSFLVFFKRLSAKSQFLV